MAKLFIIIKKQYFDEILSGKKTEEFRLVKPHWVKQIVGKEYTHIIFQNGYAANAPRLEAEYRGYDVRNIRHPFFGNDEVPVFALKLGAVYRTNHEA